jgi:hypothetical protein
LPVCELIYRVRLAMAAQPSYEYRVSPNLEPPQIRRPSCNNTLCLLDLMLRSEVWNILFFK